LSFLPTNMRLGITEYIDSAHHLPGHPKCGTIHGHTYQVDLVVTGEPKEGMLLDFAEFKAKTREVLSRYDHKSWNDFLEYPSVENICALLQKELHAALALTLTVRVWEGHGKWAEV